MRLAGLFRYPVKSLAGEGLERVDVERLGLKADRRFMVVTPSGQFKTARELPALLLIAATAQSGGIRLSRSPGDFIDVAFPADDAERQWVRVWRSDVPARVCDAAAHRWLSQALGEDVRLVYMADPASRSVNPEFGGPDDVVSFADGYPLLLASTASLDDLNGRMAERTLGLGAPCSMTRFRPNVVIEGAPAWAEDTWRVITIGSVRFRVVKPCERCVLTTLDPDTAQRSEENEPLRTLGTFRRNGEGRIMFGQNLIPMTAGSIAVGDALTVVEQGPSNVV